MDEGPAPRQRVDPPETPKERVNRELAELLGEIRVALPGLELLFGFLLILPFTESFGDLSGLERNLYLGSLVASAAAAALFVAPTARHRRHFRTLDKERLLFTANRQVLAGLVLVVVSIALVLYVVVSKVRGPGWAAVLAAAMALWFGGLWFVYPRAKR